MLPNANQLIVPSTSLSMPPKQKSLTVNVIMNVINQVSGVLFPLVTFPYVARVLQPEGIGMVNFAQAIVGYFIMVASLGIPLYGTREVAKVRDNKQKLSQLVAELFVLNMVMTLVGFAAFAIFMIFSAKAAADPVLFWVCTLPMLLAPVGFNYLFGGLEEFTFVTLRTIAFRLLTLAAIFLFINNPSDYWVYALIMGLNAVGANLVNLFFARKFLALRLIDFGKLQIWKHLRPVLLVFSLGAVISIYTSLDKVMLGYLTNEAEVGYYAVADRLIKVVVMLVTTLGTVLLPRVSYYLENNKVEEYSRLANFSLRVIFFLCLPAAAGLFVLAAPLVQLFAGDAFVTASPLVQIMGLNVVFVAMSNFMGYQVLYPQNKERLLVISVVFGAVTNFILNWFFIPRWHAMGAAMATLIAEASVTTAQVILSRPYQQFTWPVAPMCRYAGVALLMGVGVYFLSPLFDSAVVQVLVCSSMGAALYFLFMLLCRDQLFFSLAGKIPLIGKLFSSGV